MNLLANKVRIQEIKYYWLTKCMHKQEPQRVAIRFTHATIPT